MDGRTHPATPAPGAPPASQPAFDDMSRADWSTPAERWPSPTEQAELTLRMCEAMGWTFEDAQAEVKRTLDEQRNDPEWRAAWRRQKEGGHGHA